MKNKLFNVSVLALLLSASVTSTSIVAMDGDGFESALRARLKNKAAAKKISAPAAAAPSSTNALLPTQFSGAEDKSARESFCIWDDPQYKGADALNLIFSVLRDNMPLFDARNLEHLPRIQSDIRALLENPTLSVSEYKKRLIGFYFFHMFLKENAGHAVIYGVASAFANRPNYLMHHIPVQQMDHYIISTILSKKPISNGLVIRGSNRDKGQLISGLQLDSITRVEFNYYAENVDGKKYYRLYLSTNNKYISLDLLDSNPFFKGYNLTDIMAHAPCDKETPQNDIKWEWTGFILKKDGSLLEDDGIVLMGGIGEAGQDTLQAFHYGLSPYVGQHRFKAVTSARIKNQLHTSPYLNLLIDLAGGFDKIKRERLAFIPHPLVDTAEPTVSQVTFLLPYLYEIQQEMLLIEDANHEELDAAIDYAENIIVEAELAKKGITKEVFDQQVQEEVIKEIQEGSPKIIEEIDRIATDLDPSYARPKGKQKWKEKHKATRTASIAKFKSEKATIKMQERTKAICTRYLEDVNKPRYSMSETKRIRDALLNDLQSKGIVRVTGKETQRGSHAAIEVSANDRATKLGPVERSQKEGFGQKALKRIINGWMEEVSALFDESSAKK
ncbi:MAG: hypothetical protein NWS47_00560 [Alphaproteobacteria bacterium]|nr:hypothetical protein [Alphaproteobacteria bacterium]